MRLAVPVQAPGARARARDAIRRVRFKTDYAQRDASTFVPNATSYAALSQGGSV